MSDAPNAHPEGSNVPALSTNVLPAIGDTQASSGMEQEPQQQQQLPQLPQHPCAQPDDPLSCRFCHKKMGNGGAKAQHEIHCKAKGLRFPELDPGVYEPAPLHPAFVRAAKSAKERRLSLDDPSAQVPCFVCGKNANGLNDSLVCCGECDAPACMWCVNYPYRTDPESLPDFVCQLCIAADAESPAPSGAPPLSPADAKKVRALLYPVAPEPQAVFPGDSEHHASSLGRHISRLTDHTDHHGQIRSSEGHTERSGLLSHTGAPLPGLHTAESAEVEMLRQQLAAQQLATKQLTAQLQLLQQGRSFQPSLGSHASTLGALPSEMPLPRQSPHMPTQGPLHPSMQFSGAFTVEGAASASASALFGNNSSRPSIFRQSRAVKSGHLRPEVGVERPSNIKWKDELTGATEKLDNVPIKEVYDWTQSDYMQWTATRLKELLGAGDIQGQGQFILFMQEIDEVARISQNKWEVVHKYLVRRYLQLTSGAAHGGPIGRLDSTLLIEAQAGAKDSLTERVAELEAQQKAKKKRDLDQQTPPRLTPPEFAVYTEWAKLHPSQCPKCGDTFTNPSARLAHYCKCVLGRE